MLLWNVVLGNRDRQCLWANQRSSNCRLALITIEDGVCNLIPGRGQTRAQQPWTKYILKDWQVTFFQVIFLSISQNYHSAIVRMNLTPTSLSEKSHSIISKIFMYFNNLDFFLASLKRIFLLCFLGGQLNLYLKDGFYLKKKRVLKIWTLFILLVQNNLFAYC